MLKRIKRLILCARLRRNETASGAVTLREAADELDRVWTADAARGQRDSIGGAEYARVSQAPRLRALADKIDPPGEVDPERLYSGVHAAERAAA